MAQPASANRKRVMVGLIVTSFLLVVVAMASGSAPSNAPVSLAEKIAEIKSLAAGANATVVAAAAAPPKVEEAKPAAAAPNPVVAAAAAPKVEAPKAAPVVEANKAIAPAAVAAKQAKIQHLLDTRRVKLADTNSTEAPEAVAAGDAAAAEPKASEGGSKSAEGAEGPGAAGGGAFNSPMGNLNPTGIMSVFFNEKIMLTALGVIGTLLVLICCFARNADCALS